MKYLKIATVIIMFLSGISFLLNAQDKPNVIFIYTDDQGSIDLNCYGAKDLYTPNFDRLAKEGTRFTQAYVAAPVCAPSRAALLTGKYPQGAGVTRNTSEVMGTPGMPGDQYTMAEMFRDNGYKTVHIGKWHLGMSKDTGPNAQGFDYSFGHLRGCIDNYSHYFYWAGPNVHDLYENGKEVFFEGQYFPDLASDKALDYVEKFKDGPFFMFYAINMPHYPYQPTKRWRDYYKNLDSPRRDYAAFVSTIDERVGLLLQMLDDLGIRDNTIIVYQSDNGHSVEDRAMGGGGNPGPYRGAKGSLFEGGIRLPAIISWKGSLPENVVNDEMLLNVDWMPTLANLCNLKIRPKAIDGIDLSPMLLHPGETSKRKEAFWKYGTQWIVHKGKWKLLGYPKDPTSKTSVDMEKDALFLVDLENDVSERNNVADSHPEIVKELIGDYLNWGYGRESDIPKKSKPIEHKGFHKPIKAISKLNPKYSNIDVLLDGKFGITDFSSGQWIGQDGKPLEVVVDLEKTTDISAVKVNYLYSDGSWILRPKRLEVSFSNDGQMFKDLAEKTLTEPLQKGQDFTESVSVSTKAKARYVKIKVTNIDKCPETFPCAGNAPWIFIDEILIN